MHNDHKGMPNGHCIVCGSFSSTSPVCLSGTVTWKDSTFLLIWWFVWWSVYYLIHLHSLVPSVLLPRQPHHGLAVTNSFALSQGNSQMQPKTQTQHRQCTQMNSGACWAACEWATSWDWLLNPESHRAAGTGWGWLRVTPYCECINTCGGADRHGHTQALVRALRYAQIHTLSHSLSLAPCVFLCVAQCQSHQLYKEIWRWEEKEEERVKWEKEEVGGSYLWVIQRGLPQWNAPLRP